ncbi:MAG: thioredoxin family protein [Lachnospiraceae bacterium]
MAIRVSKEDFEEKVIKNALPVVVDFYSDSCVACKRLVPVLGDLEDNYEGKLEVVKVNSNFDQDLAAEYKVKSNPTILLFKEGQAIARKSGALSYTDLEEWILQNIK